MGPTREDRLAAVARARHTEELREALWAEIARKLAAGAMGDSEAAQLKRWFWEDRTEDELVSRNLERDYYCEKYSD